MRSRVPLNIHEPCEGQKITSTGVPIYEPPKNAGTEVCGYRVLTPPCVIPYLVLAARAEKESSVLLLATALGIKAGFGL